VASKPLRLWTVATAFAVLGLTSGCVDDPLDEASEVAACKQAAAVVDLVPPALSPEYPQQPEYLVEEVKRVVELAKTSRNADMQKSATRARRAGEALVSAIEVRSEVDYATARQDLLAELQRVQNVCP